MNRLYTALIIFLSTAFSCEVSAQIAPTTTSAEKVYTIDSVKVTGNDLFLEAGIIAASGLIKGTTVRIPGEQIGSGIRKLWKIGFFEDIQVSVDKMEGDKVWLNIILRELTPVTRIEFENINRALQDDLFKDIGLNTSAKVSDNLLQSTKNYIKDRYVKRGFLNAKVDIQTRPDTTRAEGQNGTYIKISLDKGDKVRVNTIAFEGNTVISNDKLRAAMKETKQIKHLNIFKASKFMEDKYEEDIENIAKKYKSLGYRDARVVADTMTLNKEDNTIDIKINIEEGNKYHYRSVKWLGNSVFSTDQLNTILGIEAGDVYNGDLLAKRINGAKDGRDIQSVYLDSGYLFAQINPVEVNAENDSIDLEIRVMEYDKAYINRINVKGNARSFDNVIYRELTTRPGDLFSKTAIMQTQQRIGQLGFFDDQNFGIDPVPNPNTNTVDINYTVVEKNSSQIELQGGWGGGQFIGTVGLTFNNFSLKNLKNKDSWKPLPMGQGQSLSLRVQASMGYTSYQFSFTEPWIGGRRPMSLSTSLYYTSQEAYNYYANERLPGKLSIFGGGVTLGKRLKWPDNYFTGSVGINYSRYDWKDYNWGLYENFDTGKSNNLNIMFGLARRSSGSSPIYPTYGSDINITAQFTPPYSLFNGRDYSDPKLTDVKRFEWLEFYKVKAKATWYNNIVGKLVLVTNAEFGYLGMYNQKVGLGPFERFQMGGSGMSQYRYYGSEIISLRGYKDNTIASSEEALNQGDPIYNKFTVELRYPITLSAATSIYGLVFAEGGNTYADFKSYSPFKLHRSVGAGVRLFMPMFGMLGFDFGYGFDPMPGQERKWEFHFTLGQQMF